MPNDPSVAPSPPRQAGVVPVAFEGFYDRTNRAAFSLAARITGDGERASEAVEAAYAEAWEAGRPEPSLSDLLAAVRERALRLASAFPPPALAASEQPQPPASGAFDSPLKGLNPLGRRALELAYFGGLAASQVAELLGESAHGVRAALRRALLDLGAALPRDPDSHVDGAAAAGMRDHPETLEPLAHATGELRL